MEANVKHKTKPSCRFIFTSKVVTNARVVLTVEKTNKKRHIVISKMLAIKKILIKIRHAYKIDPKTAWGQTNIDKKPLKINNWQFTKENKIAIIKIKTNQRTVNEDDKEIWR